MTVAELSFSWQEVGKFFQTSLQWLLNAVFNNNFCNCADLVGTITVNPICVIFDDTISALSNGVATGDTIACGAGSNLSVVARAKGKILNLLLPLVAKSKLSKLQTEFYLQQPKQHNPTTLPLATTQLAARG